MPATPDAQLRIQPAAEQRWALAGGHDDEAGLTLYLTTSGEAGESRQYEVLLPIIIGADASLEVGAAAVEEVGR